MKRIALMFVLVLSLAGMAQACPMCKDTIANTSGIDPSGGGGSSWSGGGGPGGLAGGGSPGLSSGFNLSVYAMFVGLFGTMGLIGHTIYKGVKSSPR